MNRDGRKTLYDIHSWAGFLVGIALLIVCLSGAVAVFGPEIDRWSNPSLRQIVPGPATFDADAALARLLARAPKADKPEGSRTLALPSTDLPGLYWITTSGAQGFDYLYLDAATGAIRPPRNNHVAFFLRHLHVRLLYNRLPVGIVGLAMLLSIATGLMIYKHILRDMFRMRWRRTGNIRVTMADFHKLIGFWALLFHIIIATTGTWLALEGYLRPVLSRVGGTPKVDGGDGEPLPAKAGLPSPDRPIVRLAPLIARSRGLIADFEPTYVTIDRSGSAPSVRVSGDVPGLVQQGMAHVDFDGATGRVRSVFDVHAQPFWTRFRYAIEPIHYGYYGGFWLKLLYLAVGLMPALLSITGALLWFERQRSEAKRSQRRHPPAKAAR